MTASVNERDSSRYGAGGYPNQLPLPMKSGATIKAGCGVVLNGGYAQEAAAGLGLVSAGLAYKSFDNTGGADGAKFCTVDQGVFPLANSAAGDAIAQSDAGTDCYWVDNQTVAKTNGSGTRSRAGKVMWVDSDGVWVFIGMEVHGAIAAALPATPTLVYVANDSAPATVIQDAIYDVPTTAAASTITLPAAAADGTRVSFCADGVKNGHTITYRDATGATLLTTALLASKRHLTICEKLGGKWFANAYVSP